MQEQTNIKSIRTRLPKKKRMCTALQNPHLITRELNDRSLYHFLQWSWSEISNLPFKTNWHIEHLCKELEEIAYQVGERKPKINDLLINIPPGTTKTIMCSIVFPVWCWTKWYWMRFITASYSAALSLESAEYSRDLIRSDKFQNVYPEIDIRADKDTKSNFKVIKKKWLRVNKVPRIFYGGNRFSTSVGATGAGFHADIFIWDDALNPYEAVSEKELANAARWIDQTPSTRKTDKEISATIGIMQRLSPKDPAGHLLAKRKKNLKHICLPGEIRNYRKQVQPQELIQYYKDELLDPVRLSWKVLQELKEDLGQYGFHGQIGQNPTLPGGGMFKVEHFVMIETLPSPFNFVNTIRYWDKAGSEGQGAYTVGAKLSILKNKKIIVQDIVRGQWSSEQRERIIRKTAEADGQEVSIYVEQEPGSGGKESAEASIRNLIGFSAYKDRPQGDKVYRADPFSVQVNEGNVMLLKGDWNYEFIEEFRFFPHSTYKDQVDAGSGAFSKLIKRKQARTF